MPTLSWLSTSGWPRRGRPSKRPRAVAQTKGCCWGPEKMGPPMGWLTRVTSAARGRPCARRLPDSTRRVFSPSASPSTTPVSVPSSPGTKALVTSVPPTVMRTASLGVPLGTLTSTSASPPDTWSGAPDSTVTSKRLPSRSAGEPPAAPVPTTEVPAMTAPAAAATNRRPAVPRVAWSRMCPPGAARPFRPACVPTVPVTCVTCNESRSSPRATAAGVSWPGPARRAVCSPRSGSRR